MGRFSLHPGDKRRAEAQLAAAPPITEEVFDPEVAKPTDDPFPEELDDYSSLNLAELKALCAERGLPVSGTKNTLIGRLEADDVSDSTEAPVEEAAVEEETADPEESASAPDTEEGEVSESGGESSGATTE
jgi:hypothetical protein|tara:strand:- start:1675 stop:2067 length:393 start_codon:yes stop_codon:yes gene_type:complete